MKKIKIGIIIDELFKFSLITYLILILAETVKVGFVSFYFDLNYLLLVVLVSGIIIAILGHEKVISDEKSKLTERDINSIIIFSLIGGFLVYYKTQDFGLVSLIITLLSSIIIFLLSYITKIEDLKTG